MSITFNQIRIILHEQFSFHYDQIKSETKFDLELGMDSREMIEFLNECEKFFNIKIDLDDIDKMIEKNEFIIIQDITHYINNKIDFIK